MITRRAAGCASGLPLVASLICHFAVAPSLPLAHQRVAARFIQFRSLWAERTTDARIEIS
jgi:hypothetical protein